MPEVRADEVRVRLLAAPVNPADLNQIAGKYPVRFPLPATPGFEGVGVVEEIGAEVRDLQSGTRVILPHDFGTWREECVLKASELVAIPAEIDVLQAAMLKINPFTAWRLLHDYVTLRPGEYIIQNAANSGAGQAVIQLAHALGWKTINVVRRAELIDELRALGGDVVLLDDDNLREAVKGTEIRLALNAVGGESALRVMNCLSPGGTMVTYGAMSLQPLRIPNGMLIFKDLRFRGIWINKLYEESTPSERAQTWEKLIALARTGKLRAKVAATYPLAQVKEAVAKAAEGKRDGKVLLTF